MKHKIYTSSLLILLTFLFSCEKKIKKEGVEQIKNKRVSLTSPKFMVGTCDCGCFKEIVGLIDFYGNSNPLITYACSDFGEIEIKKTQNFTGVYEMSVNGFEFDPNKTWIYVQSENSNWREIQAQVQPNGVIFIQANQNGVLTNILTQNVSFKIVVF